MQKSVKDKLQSAKQKQIGIALDCSAREAKLLGLISRSENKSPDTTEPVYVVLKYFQPTFECFSDWQAEELAAFSGFLEKLSARTWQQVYKTAGSLGNKTGLGYTVHLDRSKLPECPTLDAISEDIKFFELRVNEKARVHGFRVQSAFFLVWLDRQHKIYKM